MLWPTAEQHASSGAVGYLLRTAIRSTEQRDSGGLWRIVAIHTLEFMMIILLYGLFWIPSSDLCQFMSAHDDHDYASTQSFRLWWCDVPESPGPFSHEVHDHGFCAVHVLRRARQENDPGNVRQIIDQHLGVILTKFKEIYWEIGHLKNISSVLKSIQNCQDDNKKLDFAGLDKCQLISSSVPMVACLVRCQSDLWTPQSARSWRCMQYWTAAVEIKNRSKTTIVW